MRQELAGGMRAAAEAVGKWRDSDIAAGFRGGDLVSGTREASTELHFSCFKYSGGAIFCRTAAIETSIDHEAPASENYSHFALGSCRDACLLSRQNPFRTPSRRFLYGCRHASCGFPHRGRASGRQGLLDNASYFYLKVNSDLITVSLTFRAVKVYGVIDFRRDE